MKNVDRHIRPATSGDTSLLAHMIRESFRDVAERFDLTPKNCPKHPSNCSDEWTDGDLNRGVRYFILEQAGIRAGCAALEDAGDGIFYLERLAVLPEYRRTGVGTELVKHILDVAQSSDATKVGIGIISGQEDLKRWYQKLGFTVTATREFKHLPFEVLFMEYTFMNNPTA